MGELYHSNQEKHGDCQSICPTLNHYKAGAVEHLRTHRRALELASDELDQVTQAITKDEENTAKVCWFHLQAPENSVAPLLAMLKIAT